MPEDLPSHIGRYKIVDELGRGGFGLVYRAYDPTVGRQVAIKILTQVSRDVLTRFRNEAQVAGNLRHENIVTVYEYGTHEEAPFIAMEYLEGEDLHHIITSKKPLTLLEKCNIMSQVAEGLDCAHKSGVIHRDIKPANIMVLRDGRVKIMDFGIARLMRDGDATRLTQQGYLIGTLHYMAPEQLSGADFDVLCDIFAYGVIFYELVTGRHPFEASDARSMMYKMAFDEPRPIREFVPEVPDALQRVITRTIQRDRELRYQTLKEVQFDTDPIRIELQRERAGTLLAQAQQLLTRRSSIGRRRYSGNPRPGAIQPDRAGPLGEGEKQLQSARSAPDRIAAESWRGASDKAAVLRSRPGFESATRLDSGNIADSGRIEFARAWRNSPKSIAIAGGGPARIRATEPHRRVPGSIRSAESRSGKPRGDGVVARHTDPDGAAPGGAASGGCDPQSARAAVDPGYDEAIAPLTGLGPDAESPKVRRALELVRIEKAEHERKQRLRNEMAEATDLLRNQRLDEAAKCLESLQREFPANNEVANLLAYAQKELAKLARTRAVESWWPRPAR